MELNLQDLEQTTRLIIPRKIIRSLISIPNEKFKARSFHQILMILSNRSTFISHQVDDTFLNSVD